MSGVPVLWWDEFYSLSAIRYDMIYARYPEKEN